MDFCDGFHFAEHAFWQCLDGHAGAGGFAREILLIDGVERGEIRHIRQKAGRLDDFLEAAAGGFQNGAEILDGAMRLSGHILPRDFPRRRI